MASDLRDDAEGEKSVSATVRSWLGTDDSGGGAVDYADLVESAADGIAALSPDLEITFANDAVQRLLGYESAALTGEHLSVVVDDAGVERTESAVESLRRRGGGGSETVELELDAATGERIPVEAHLSSTGDGESFEGVVCVFRDIAERREREAALERYRTVTETAGDMVYILDREGEFQFVNDAAERLTGYDREELVGSHVGMFMGEDAIETGQELIKDLLDAEARPPESHSYEWDLQRADGSVVPCESQITLFWKDGEWRGTVGVVREVTARKERERRIEQLESLEKLQAELTEEVGVSVEELLDTSEQVSASSGEISDLAREQADTMSEISGEVSNLSAVVEEIASLSDEVKRSSERARELAEEGHESATDATAVMEHVQESTAAAAAEFEELREQIAAIDEVVDVIDDIANQTNILALNASIEAAQAGDSGEGFAVVADEVKDLAEQTQQQAGRIEQRVARIQRNTDETVEQLRATTEQVPEGMEEVERTMRSLDDIVEAVTETAQGIEEVAGATDDQAASAEEIAGMTDNAVGKADRVSEEIGEIADANRRQVEQVEGIRESLDRANEHLEDVQRASESR